MRKLLRLLVLAGLVPLLVGATTGYSVDAAGAESLSDARPAVTFVGFHAFPDGKSRVFAQLTRRPELRFVTANQRIVFTLVNSQILSSNNKNPLNLEHFATPANRVQLVSRDNDVDLVIELKRSAEFRHRLSNNADGSVTLQVDFPAE